MTRAAVSVGIVNHNGARYLPRTLEGVRRCGPIVAEVLLVDNASTDGSVDHVRSVFPSIRVIEAGSNRGPGAARNIALGAAVHDRVLLIDNDAIPQPGCIESLGAALDAHPAAILAMPAVLDLDDPDRVQYAGADAHVLGTCRLLSAGEPAAALEPEVRNVGSAVTACVLADRSRFRDEGWFDEALFFYLEDHELGLRARLLGFELLRVPRARCLHGRGTVGVSIRETGRFTPVRVRYTIRNRWIVLLKLYRWPTLLRFLPALAAFEVLQLAGSALRGWLGHWCWAVGSLLLGLPDLRRRRRTFQRRRRVGDLSVLMGGPFPFHDRMHTGPLERGARRLLDAVISLNWRLAGPGTS